MLFALLLLLLAAELEPDAPIIEATLSSILTSTLGIGVASAAALFVFGSRIRRCLQQAEP